jgi:hypothetical protein
MERGGNHQLVLVGTYEVRGTPGLRAQGGQDAMKPRGGRFGRQNRISSPTGSISMERGGNHQLVLVGTYEVRGRPGLRAQGGQDATNARGGQFGRQNRISSPWGSISMGRGEKHQLVLVGAYKVRGTPGLRAQGGPDAMNARGGRFGRQNRMSSPTGSMSMGQGGKHQLVLVETC